MTTTGAPQDRQAGAGSTAPRPVRGTPGTPRPAIGGSNPAVRTSASGRAQAPIRWPRPDRTTLALIGVWAIGVIVALFVPASLVNPTALTAPSDRVWLAFGATLVGATVMLVAALGLYRRHRDAAVLILGGVPAAACVIGGVIFTAAKLTGY